MHYLAHSGIKNMNIALTSKYAKMCNRRNIFIDFFKRGNTVCTPVNSTILDICNCLKNFILYSFGQLKFFKYRSDNTYQNIYTPFNLLILLKYIKYQRLLIYTSCFKSYIKYIASKLLSQINAFDFPI